MFGRPKHNGGIYEMLLIALPMFVSMGCDSLMTFTDRLFLAKISPNHMNAALGGGFISWTLITFFNGLISYSAALVAQYLGSGKKENSAKVTYQSFILAIFSYPILILFGFLLMSLFPYFNMSDEQLALQTTYFSILMYGSILTLLRSSFSSFFSGIGRTHMIMISAIVSGVVNIGVNYVLIFGKLGFKAYGIRGAAYGTIIGNIVGVLLLAFLYFSKKIVKEFDIKKSLKFDKSIMKLLLKYGTPQGVEMLLAMAAFSCLPTLFQSEGEVVATAATIMFNWDGISFVPLLGIEVAVTSLVGRYVGAKDFKSAIRATKSGLLIGLMYSFIILCLYLTIPDILVNLFRPNGDCTVFNKASVIAIEMLQIAVIYVLADAGTVCFSGALRGAGDTVWTMVYGILVEWMTVVVLWLSLKVFHFSPTISWVATVLCFIASTVIFFIRFKQGKWKEINLLDNA